MPYVGHRVVESWAHYSLELGGGQHGDERWTNEAGWVEFPRRTIRMSALNRLFRGTVTYLNRYLDGSTGVAANLQVNGPQGTKILEYQPGNPPPDNFVLSRKASSP